MKKLRIGIVGCGRISIMYKIAFLSLLDQIEVVIAVDTDIEKAREFAQAFGCEYSDDISDAFNKQLDVLHLCTPHYLHAPQAISAMNAGINVLTEKPMAISLTEADAMIECSEKTGMTLGIIFQSRYIAGVQEMKRVIDQGKIGRLLGTYSTMHWSRPPSYYECGWKGKWSTEGGGLLIDQTIHTIDMVQWLINSPVKWIHGHYDTRVLTMIEVEDVADAVMEFENGCRYSMFACNYNINDSPIEFKIFGEKGWVGLVGSTATISIRGETEYVVRPPASEIYQGKNYWGNFHHLQIQDFYNSVRNKTTPSISGKDGRKALEIVLAIYESSRKNARINF